MAICRAQRFASQVSFTDAHGATVIDVDKMARETTAAVALLKSLSHRDRLSIACQLTTGEKSVNELSALLGAQQAAVSQQLARLRLEGVVRARRDGKMIYYSLRDPNVRSFIALITDIFCAN